MSDDGWTTVTYKKPKKPKDPSSSSGVNASIPAGTTARPTGPTVVKKAGAGQNKKKAPAVDPRLLDEDTGDYHIKTVGAATGKRIAQARQAKGLTQKQLAAMIQEQVSVIQAYERGDAIPDQRIFAKIEKVVGKVRGKPN